MVAPAEEKTVLVLQGGGALGGFHVERSRASGVTTLPGRERESVTDRAEQVVSIEWLRE